MTELNHKYFESLSSDDLRKKELNDRNLWYIHFIFSFNNAEQEMFSQFVPRTMNDDKKFIKYVTGFLRKKEKLDLYKISTCMYYVDDENDLPDFLLKRNGKYFFHIDNNDDTVLLK